ncbi:GNAT family N-acetyltransferase [Bradyrhizobium sp. 2S1]|uniref:GNAT family N-acetyltransferase n=1 Tax=Bradyrhizobium sp. 2S1 TaxID=1404429 RepID=UPI00289A965A|nr:GNAT family N-acetyltransferase [Bradyrhizobium sp. 2S1]
MECTIRPARQDDAGDISAVILRALRETNARDYASEIIERVERSFSPDAVLQLIGKRTVFVAAIDGRVVGTASLDGNVVRTVFVSPDVQARGIGRLLMESGRAHGTREKYPQPGCALIDQRRDLLCAARIQGRARQLPR